MFFDHLPENGFICAHRGVRSIAPENTLMALEKARKCGAHCWETDVRMSKDGELIIFHDDTLERTTDVATNKDLQNRYPWQTDQFTAAELQKLDAGSWFLKNDPFGTIASGEVRPEEKETIRSQKIPLLRDILKFTKAHHFPVNLEIKDLKTPEEDVAIIDNVMDMLLETETMDLVLLSSFRPGYLRRARTLSQRISLAVLAEKQHPPNLNQYLSDLSAAAYHPETQLCDLALINDLKKAGYRVNIWTMNDPGRAKKLFDAGLGIITEWPQRMTTLHKNSNLQMTKGL